MDIKKFQSVGYKQVIEEKNLRGRFNVISVVILYSLLGYQKIDFKLFGK